MIIANFRWKTFLFVVLHGNGKFRDLNRDMAIAGMKACLSEWLWTDW